MELIYQYDPHMRQQDKEYLMQLEDRQAVINTLESKLKWAKDNYDEATEGDEWWQRAERRGAGGAAREAGGRAGGAEATF